MSERAARQPEQARREARVGTHGETAPRPADSVMWLQRAAGNAAVSSLLGGMAREYPLPAARRADGGEWMAGPPSVQLALDTASTAPTIQRQGGGAKKIGHATGKEIDSFLIASTLLKPYVEGKMKGGTKAEKAVIIDNAADFKTAWVAYAMKRTNSDTGKDYTKAEAEAAEPDINAFQDETVPSIHVHESRGERATTIHESMHLFQNDSFLTDVGFNVNEGTTEFFTREVTTEQKIKRGNYYPDQFGSVSKLVGVSSKEKLADAYFKHTMDGIKDGAEAKGKGTWDKWVGFVKGGQYDKADKLLK